MARRIEFEVLVDSDGAVTALQQVADTAEETGQSLQEMGEEGQQAADKGSVSMAGLKGALGAVATAAAAAAAAVAAVGAAVVQMAARNDEIAKTAAAIGTTAEEVQLLTGAFELGGVSAGQAINAVRRLSVNLGEAARGTGAATDAMAELGLTVDQLEALPVVERFSLIADSLQQVETQSLRARIAQDLLGRAGVELLAAFQNGGEGIRLAAGAIERAGIVSNEAAAESEALTDQVTLFQASLRRLMADGLEPLVAPMTRFIEQINDSIFAYRRLRGLLPEVVTEQTRQVEVIERLSRELAEADTHVEGLRITVQALANDPSLVDTLEEMQAALEGATARQQRLRRELEEARGGFREAAQATRQAADASREMTGAVEEEAEALEGLNGQLKETTKLKTNQTAKTEELAEKSTEEAAAIVAAADAQREAADKREKTLAAMVQSQKDAYEDILSTALSVTGLIQQAEQEAMNQRIEEAQTASERVRRIQEQLGQATSQRTRERLNEELAAARQMEQLARDEATQAFARSKALALSQAVISTAQAVAGAIAIPPQPNIPLAIAAGALGGAQIAAIAAEPAPSFHSGGLLRDEMMIRARAGEAVLSPQAVSAVGGEPAIRALNSGGATGPTTIVVEQKVRTRVLDSQVYDLGRSGQGALQQQISRGQPRPGSHRPVGMG